MIALSRSTGSTTRPRMSRRLAAGLGAVALLLAACSDGPGDEQDLVDALVADDAFEQNVAECIAAAVFEEYGEDDDALEKISFSASFEQLDSSEGIPGFGEFFTETIDGCRTVGP